MKFTMRNNRTAALFLLLLLCCHGLILAVGYDGERYEGERGREHEEEEKGERERWGGEGGSGGGKKRERKWEEEEEGEREWGGKKERPGWFLLRESKEVIRTDAGEMRVVRGVGGRVVERPLHIGFLTMEPKTLLVPQYLDSSLLIFVRRGEAKLGTIYKDDYVERRLKIGDIYWIPAGYAFYLFNTGEGQRLHIICGIDPSETLGFDVFESFYIAGGGFPTSILAGFGPETLTSAFNASGSEVREILTRQQGGPIVYISERAEQPPRVWSKFLEMKEEDKHRHFREMIGSDEEYEQEPWWSWRKLFDLVFRQTENKGGKESNHADSCNIYGRSPDFKNDYGWSIALDGSRYKPLKRSGISVYLVNLTAGSMMAPHLNPTATEYGVVLRGSGRIQIVSPNGTSIMNARIREGDVFWIPRYFPFCHIASRTGPLEFFGFTTSARKNRPQFLVGANSLLHALNGPELAAAFGVSEDKLRRLLEAQREAVILPTAAVAPPDESEGGEIREKSVL